MARIHKIGKGESFERRCKKLRALDSASRQNDSAVIASLDYRRDAYLEFQILGRDLLARLPKDRLAALESKRVVARNVFDQLFERLKADVKSEEDKRLIQKYWPSVFDIPAPHNRHNVTFSDTNFVMTHPCNWNTSK